MLLRDFIKKSQIETDENEILLLEDFFGINVSTSHPLELISDIETFLMTAWKKRKINHATSSNPFNQSWNSWIHINKSKARYQSLL